MTGPVETGEAQASVEPDTPVTDRGVSPVAGRTGGRRARLVTVAALVTGCGVFLAATWDRGHEARRSPSGAEAPPRELAPFEPARREPPLLTGEQASDAEAPGLAHTENVPELVVGDDPGRQSAGPSPAEQRRALAQEARRSPLMAFSAGSDGPRPAGVQDNTGAVPRTASTTLDGLRATTPIAIAAAERTIDRNLLLGAGASIPCILQTALDSTTPGLVACVLPQDVYSDAGTVILLERGTRVLGEYQGGLQQGRRRLFVLWTRAVTPDGVSIALASPAADALGRAGVDGEVDNHFRERFGGALLLSLVDEGASAAFGRRDGPSGVARAPSDAAAIALGGSIGIPPTLRAPQGAELTILTAQDLDFRAVYWLRARP